MFAPPVSRLRADGCARVPHVRQQADWDCGLACALSVLRTFGLSSHSYAELQSRVGTESVWSIDLVLLLHALGLDVSYHTTTLGVNPTHARMHYYEQDWQADHARVVAAFARAADLGIPVQQQSLSSAAFLSLLPPLTNAVALVLVNPAFLHCAACGTHAQSALSGEGFTGHFIVCTGVERRRGVSGGEVELVTYVDPASACAVCRVGASWLEQARRADGTDEDCIVITGRRSAQPAPAAT